MYTLRSTIAHEYLDMDVGCYLIALGVCRGLFKDYETVKSLLNGSEYRLRWKDDVLEFPLFLKSKPCGLGVTDEPMTDVNHREYLQHISIKCGMGGSESGVLSYPFRRNMAIVVAAALGSHIAHTGMGHAADTTTMEESYDDNNSRTDYVGAMMNEAIRPPREAKILESHAFNRLEPHLFKMIGLHLTFRELCVRVPILKLLAKQAKDLYRCVEQGENDWKTFVVCGFVFRNSPSLTSL
ncbi:hypothetical protein JAAARDRAFT_140436 [Jaapia argillacea MUCL 33604]|uniref:Uncharacterized protein n=1 Tax=Jaapia argillacea MUCL 33604 TaxID=933084 RepID=A0A067P9D9_9AGAM|nr:hypothetical protein JAAARDRAFT_140436 [Jaapia argillacea MUCL 33604]